MLHPNLWLCKKCDIMAISYFLLSHTRLSWNYRPFPSLSFDIAAKTTCDVSLLTTWACFFSTKFSHFWSIGIKCPSLQQLTPKLLQTLAFSVFIPQLHLKRTSTRQLIQSLLSCFPPTKPNLAAFVQSTPQQKLLKCSAHPWLLSWDETDLDKQRCTYLQKGFDISTVNWWSLTSSHNGFCASNPWFWGPQGAQGTAQVSQSLLSLDWTIAKYLPEQYSGCSQFWRSQQPVIIRQSSLWSPPALPRGQIKHHLTQSLYQSPTHSGWRS